MSESIARRYAKALCDLAEETKCLDQVAGDLAGFDALLASSADLREALSNPSFVRAERHAVLEALVKKSKFTDISRNFLFLLVDNNRMVVFPTIRRSFQALVDSRQGRVQALVTSAAPLDKTSLKTLTDHIKAVTGANQVEINAQVDASLIGGIVTRVGDRVFDGSIRTQLDALKFQLMNQDVRAEA